MGDNGVGGFGDARLRRVGARLVEAMQAAPTMCLHALAADRCETVQFGRFLDNDVVSSQEMLVHTGRVTGQRAAGRHILAIHDTTEMHFATHAASKRGFGKGGNGRDIGLFLHPTIAVDAQTGGVIGLVDAQVINRVNGKVGNHHMRAADDKESRRWLDATRSAAAVLEPAASVTMGSDRESDIYTLFAGRPEQTHLVCRAAQNRVLATGTKLFAECAAWPERHRDTVEVPVRGSQPARSATVALRFGEVTVRRPPGLGSDVAASVTMRVVDVAEIDPANHKSAVHWCLLTTHTVPDLDQARQIVRWYQARWTIEQVFRTLKSAGAQAEASQLADARRFTKLAVIALIAAVRIMQIVIGRDGSTGQTLADVADPADTPMLKALNTKLEGRTALLKNPHGAKTLAWYAWIVGRLGGWSGYTSKGYKPPGPKTVARGLTKLETFADGWRLARCVDV